MVAKVAKSQLKITTPAEKTSLSVKPHGSIVERQ